MAQDVQVAGLRDPLTSGQDPAAGLIQQAGAAVSRFREGSLEDRVASVARDAAELADENRTQLAASSGAFGSGANSPDESAALLGAAEGQSAESLLAARETEVTDQANRVFGRYRRALGQGATNASAARIAVEKEMNDLISSNPAFADSIRTAAARALGQTEFQVLTQDRPRATGSTATSQFEKDRQSVMDALDAQATLQNWSPTYKESRTRQAMSDLATRYELENSNQFFQEGATFDKNQFTLKVAQVRNRARLGANALITRGLDAIDQSGQAILGEQQVANLRVQVQSEMNQYRQELEAIMPDTMSQEDRNTNLQAALQPFQQVMTALEGNRASEVLKSIRGAQQLGTEMAFSELLPFTMGMSDAFGQNYEFVSSQFEPGKFADLVFQNAGAPELREMVNNGEITREQLPQLISGRIQRARNAAVMGDPNTDWRTLGAGYLGPMTVVPKARRDVDDGYGEVLDSTAANSPVEVQKQITGTAQLDKFQLNVVNTWATAVDTITDSVRKRVQGRQGQENYDTYVMATVGPDNRLRYIEYTAVRGRDPDTGEDVWRIQGRRPIENLSNAVSRLTNRYGIGNGKSRSILSHPQLNQSKFQGMAESDYVQSVQDRINSNRDVPEWISSVAPAGTVRQEDISESRVAGFFNAVGRAVFGPPAAPADQEVEGRVSVQRIKRAVRDLEAGRPQTPADRKLAEIFATPSAEDLGITEEQLTKLSDEERYRLIADTINERLGE